MAFHELIAVAFADVNTSVGVVGLMLAIVALVLVLLSIIAIEVAGEHRANVARRRQHHG